MKKLLRTYFIVPVLVRTGYRFSKTHRINRSILYRILNTTLANIEADWSW